MISRSILSINAKSRSQKIGVREIERTGSTHDCHDLYRGRREKRSTTHKRKDQQRHISNFLSGQNGSISYSFSK